MATAMAAAMGWEEQVSDRETGPWEGGGDKRTSMAICLSLVGLMGWSLWSANRRQELRRRPRDGIARTVFVVEAIFVEYMVEWGM